MYSFNDKSPLTISCATPTLLSESTTRMGRSPNSSADQGNTPNLAGCGVSRRNFRLSTSNHKLKISENEVIPGRKKGLPGKHRCGAARETMGASDTRL